MFLNFLFTFTTIGCPTSDDEQCGKMFKREDCRSEIDPTIRCFCPEMCAGVVTTTSAPKTTAAPVTKSPTKRVTKPREIVIPNGGKLYV